MSKADHAADDETLALESRTDSPPTPTLIELFPAPQVVPIIAGKVRILNLSEAPCIIRRISHLCQVNPMFVQDTGQSDLHVPPADLQAAPSVPTCGEGSPGRSSESVIVDPDKILPSKTKCDFHAFHSKHDDVFSSLFKGYNSTPTR